MLGKAWKGTQAGSMQSLVLPNRYDQDAVSVRRGGIVDKLPQWQVVRKKWLLAVEDPQVSCFIALQTFVLALHRCVMGKLDDCPDQQLCYSWAVSSQTSGASFKPAEGYNR